MRKVFGEAQYKVYEHIVNDRGYYKKLLENLVAQVIYICVDWEGIYKEFGLKI